MGIVKRFLRREKRDRKEPPAPAVQRRPEAGPALILLMPDANGVATYSLASFPTARSAEIYADSNHRGQLIEGSALFWALSWRPVFGGVGGAHAEPIVVIRDARAPVVYPFSFSDIESANEFVRYEMRRGLDLSQVMIYWAVTARVELDFWGRSTIIPPAAPLPTPQVWMSVGASGPLETADDLPPLQAGAVEDGRRLADSDIAEVVRLVQGVSAEGEPDARTEAPIIRLPVADNAGAPVPIDGGGAHEVIDFPTASQKVQAARSSLQAAVLAWGSVAVAIDEALDVFIGRQVVARLAWSRMSRAFAEAAQASHAEAIRRAWSNAAAALLEGCAEWRRRSAVSPARTWATASRELAAAASVRAMRSAWLNIAWTLEEAAYAHALERKARVLCGWRNATLAIGEMCDVRASGEAGLQAAWVNAAVALREAGLIAAARPKMFGRTWTAATFALASAAATKQQRDRTRVGLRNMFRGLEGAVEAKAWRDEIVDAWVVATEALKLAAEACVSRDRALLAWANVASALEGVCAAYVRKLTMTIRTWSRVAAAIGEALEAKARRDAAAAAWHNAGIGLGEACLALLQLSVARSAWQNAAMALEEAVLAHLRHQGLLFAWTRAALAMKDAAATKARINGLRRCWLNASIAVAGAALMQQRRLSTITAWDNASLGIKEALVAEAKLRIAESGLDKELMFEVDSAVKEAQKATMRCANDRNGHKAGGLTEVQDASRSEGGEAGEASRDEAAAFAPFGFWESPETGSWRPRDEPFKGFNSPKGRF